MLQVALAAVLSVAYGANTGQTTMGIVAMMHVITKSQAVPETATPGIVLHVIKTVAMLCGAISWGGSHRYAMHPFLVVSISFCISLPCMLA